jgi:long-subunit fatty acid transport protein
MALRPLVVLSLLVPCIALGQSTGTYDFLRLEAGARVAALNGTSVSLTNDPNLLFSNPASLSTLSRRSASVGYLKHLLDVNSGNLSYGQSIGDYGFVGGGILFVDYGSMDKTDELFNVLGTFGARDLAVVGGWGYGLNENASIGASLKFIYSSIADYSSTGLALDIGALYQLPEERITLGASILNLGTQLSTYAGAREKLPLDMTIGMSIQPKGLPAVLSLNFHKLNEADNGFFSRFAQFSVGAEFLLSENIQLRAGYNNERRTDLKLGTSSGLAGFAFGGGVRVSDYLVDYAFTSYGAIGGLHRVSLGMTL